jgi:leucine zipper transcription factor-like protein 1
MDLTDIHQGQVSRFTQFFKGKRDSSLHDRTVLNQQFMSDYLSDDTAIFNCENVQGILAAYQQQAMEGLSEELEKVVKLSAVYCTELMRAAQAQGVNLQAGDISIVEDANRQHQVNAMTAVGRAPPARSNSLLPTLGGEGRASDPGLLRQLEDSREETRKMTERYQAMQNEVTSLLQERSSLSSELETVKSSFTELRTYMAAAGSDAASQQRAGELEQRLVHTQQAATSRDAQLDQMRREMEGRLGDSSQFKQLKTIIKEKNNQIKILRGQLQAAGYQLDAGGTDLTADSD